MEPKQTGFPAHQGELIDTEPAAAYLGLSPKTLEAWRTIKTKDVRRSIPFIRLGGRVKYRRRDLDAWLEANRVSK